VSHPGDPARRVGLDVGGTKALGVALGPDGSIIAEARTPTPRGDGSVDALIDQLAELCTRLGAERAVGVGVPGLVTTAGVMRAAPNLDGVADLDVAGRLAARTGLDVHVDNDATCAALAEWRLGCGRGTGDFVMVTLGTGIGGGLVAGGVLQRGVNGFAGEIGHMVIDPHGPPCPCGRIGCWETLASGTGLRHLAASAVAEGRLPALADARPVTGERVHDLAVGGDRDALSVIEEWARWVAVGLSNLTNILDPQLFVLGGGLATGADVYLPAIRRAFARQLYQAELRTVPAVEFGALGSHAGAIGAALLSTHRTHP